MQVGRWLEVHRRECAPVRQHLCMHKMLRRAYRARTMRERELKKYGAETHVQTCGGGNNSHRNYARLVVDALFQNSLTLKKRAKERRTIHLLTHKPPLCALSARSLSHNTLRALHYISFILHETSQACTALAACESSKMMKHGLISAWYTCQLGVRACARNLFL